MSTAEVDPYQLHSAFSDTAYGERLAGQVRFGRYKPEDMGNEAWVDLLGADVNNLDHMPLTLGLTKDFIRCMDVASPGELSDDDKQLLQVAAISHDWGEAIVTDITYSKKTKEDERREKEAFLEIMATEMSAVPGSDLVVEAAHEVVFDQVGTRLGKMFNVVERVGYMRTALRAHVRVHEVTCPELANGLRWLTADVLGNNPGSLVEHALVSPPAHAYLTNQADVISEAFTAVTDEVFANYGGESATKQVAVATSLAQWQGWLSRSGLAVPAGA